MANDFTGRTWKIDTKGATSVQTGPVYIGDIEWRPNAQSDAVTVLDSHGATIWTKTATAATPSGDAHWKNPCPHVPYDGFNVSDLTSSGVLYVTVI